MPPTLANLLAEVVTRHGSDLHVAAGQKPMVRVEGAMEPLHEVLSFNAVDRLLVGALEPRQREALTARNSVDFVLEVDLPGGARRFRANLFRDRRGLNGAFRLIAEVPPTLASLRLPARLAELVRHRQGLVLVTGPASTGKTTTLASLIHYLNHTRAGHVITLEDPVEYVHRSNRCLVSQREVGRDTRTFATGLRAALREAPDVILVGELRDLESTSLAVTAAETGHLVMATMHTSSAASTIERVINSFPANQQAQVRTMLADSIRGVVTQYLVPRADGRGRIPSVEVMLANGAISNLIRESRTFQIPGVLETSRAQGMQTMDQSLEDLLNSGLITRQVAHRHASEKRRFAPPEAR